MCLRFGRSQTNVETFLSLLKESPDQNKVRLFSGVLWDKAWPRVDVFILGICVLLLLWVGTRTATEEG